MNVHQIQSSTLDTGKATALWNKLEKMKLNLLSLSLSLQIGALFSFLPPFYSFSDMDFAMDSHEQANVKGSLHKNLKHWHHIGANPSVIYTIENG